MTYPDWILEQLAYYERALELLEREYADKLHEEYLKRKASLIQCLNMLRELAEPPVERDSA